MGLHVVGLDFQGLAVMGDGLVDLPATGQGEAEVVVGERICEVQANAWVHNVSLFRQYEVCCQAQAISLPPARARERRQAQDRRRTQRIAAEMLVSNACRALPQTRAMHRPICGRYRKRSAITCKPTWTRPTVGSSVPRYQNQPTASHRCPRHAPHKAPAVSSASKTPAPNAGQILSIGPPGYTAARFTGQRVLPR